MPSGFPPYFQVYFNDFFVYFTSRYLPLSYDVRNVKVLNRHERACIQAPLDLVRRLDASRPEDVLVKAVRAAFWEAVWKGGDVSPESLACSGAYVHPERWEEVVEEAVLTRRGIFLAEKEAFLKNVCRRAFLNAATSLPVAIYGSAVKVLRVPAPELKDVKVHFSLGNTLGVLPGECTGLLKDICLAIDSVHFLKGTFTQYLEDSYAFGPEREKTFFPRFHANMTAWTKSSCCGTLGPLLERAEKEWPSACPRHLNASVLQWMWQRVAFKAVSESALPVDVSFIMRKCAADLGVEAAVADERASEWENPETNEVEAAACAVAFEGREQWNYYRAVVEFYVALRIDTDVFSGVFNASRFLAELARHRGFVVSWKMYLSSLELHGVSHEELDSPLCTLVYAAMAAIPLHKV